MNNRTPHCIKLNEREEKDFQAVKKATGFGLTRIFNDGVRMLKEKIVVADKSE
jgi:hypothetical protein